MTAEGLNRIATLFASDIDKVTYTQNGAVKEQSISSITVTDNKFTIILNINKADQGTFDNFKIINKTGIVMVNKILSFTKTSDEIVIDFPFTITAKEV